MLPSSTNQRRGNLIQGNLGWKGKKKENPSHVNLFLIFSASVVAVSDSALRVSFLKYRLLGSIGYYISFVSIISARAHVTVDGCLLK